MSELTILMKMQFVYILVLMGLSISLLYQSVVTLLNLLMNLLLTSLVLRKLMVMSLMTLIYVFALIAKFKQQTPTMIKNGLLLAIEHAPYSIIMLSIAGALVIGVPLCVHWAGLLSLVLSFSLTAYIQSYFLNKLFKKVLKRSC